MIDFGKFDVFVLVGDRQHTGVFGLGERERGAPYLLDNPFGDIITQPVDRDIDGYRFACRSDPANDPFRDRIAPVGELDLPKRLGCVVGVGDLLPGGFVVLFHHWLVDV